jgi:hypothetical protein
MQTTVPRGRTYYCFVSQFFHIRDRLMQAYLSSLLEWLLVHSDENDGMWSKAIFSCGLHILYQVLACSEIDEGIGAQLLQAHLLLLVTRVNGNHLETHGTSVLLSERSKSTTSTDNGDGLAWASTRLLKTLVDGDTGAENWGDGIEWDFFWNAGNVCGLCNGVLLEGSVDCVSREKCLCAKLRWLLVLALATFTNSTHWLV